MRLKSIITFSTLATALLLFLQGCNNCSVEGGTITFDAASQYASITYLVDSSGANYCTDIYRPNLVRVMFNNNGGEGQFTQISEDLSDGMIGPLTYTTTPEQATKGTVHHYMYIIQKDTFGIDTLEAKFYPAVDECSEFWSVAEFYLNGVLQPAGSPKEILELVIRE